MVPLHGDTVWDMMRGHGTATPSPPPPTRGDTVWGHGPATFAWGDGTWVPWRGEVAWGSGMGTWDGPFTWGHGMGTWHGCLPCGAWHGDTAWPPLHRGGGGQDTVGGTGHTGWVSCVLGRGRVPFHVPHCVGTQQAPRPPTFAWGHAVAQGHAMDPFPWGDGRGGMAQPPLQGRGDTTRPPLPPGPFSNPQRSLAELPLRPDKLIAGITVLGRAPVVPPPAWKSPGGGAGGSPGSPVLNGAQTPTATRSPRGPPGAHVGPSLSRGPPGPERVPSLGGCSPGTRLPWGCSRGSLPPDPLLQCRKGGVPHPPGSASLPAPRDGPGTCCLPAASRRGEASGDGRGGGLTPHPWQGTTARGYRRAAQRPGPAPVPRPPAAHTPAPQAPGEPRPCRCSRGGGAPPTAAVDMQPGYAAVLCVLAVLGLEAAAPGECELSRLLQDKLQYEMRLQYMKHNFPIDYTVQVQYEEVLRPSNITRLRNGTVSEAALRYLWFHVSSQAVLRIREVLPEKHPSWKYTQELGQLFDALGKEYSKYRQTDVEAVVADLVKLVHSAGAESRRKAVRPKALLDNCLKVMRMLYGAPCRWEST
ncbi:interleukin-34 isoform X2 [Chroicocephalus ridibundus]|uniref:interleukin-34 isoform X2 n=1 Tax=Chroicocephalus ridibundus TaxID=1192867 RepID=UPI002FDE4BF3